MGTMSHEERWAARDLEAKQCCGTLNFWQKLVLWSGACFFILWVARVDVIEPASNSPGPLQWSWRGKEAPAVAPLRMTVALYPASSLAPQTSYLRDFLQHHGSHVAWTFKPYETLEDLLTEAKAGDVVVYHGNMTLPAGLHADRAHQGCLYCHAEGNVLLHDAVSRALLSLPVPITLLPAHDVLCKLSFPASCRHRVLRGVFGRRVAHAHSLATLPLPTHHAFPHPDTHTEPKATHTHTHKTSSSSSSAVSPRPALLPSSRRPLTLAVAGEAHPGIQSAASLLSSSLSLSLASTATLPALPSSPAFASTLAKCRFVLLPANHPTAHDTLLAALDAGTIPILLYEDAAKGTEESGCDDALGWVRDNGAPVYIAGGDIAEGLGDVASQLSDIVTGKGKGVDGTQAALLAWWDEYKAGVIGSILAFTIQSRAAHDHETTSSAGKKTHAMVEQPQCSVTPLGQDEARRAVRTYTDYYADASWFAKGPDARCASLCDVADGHCVHVASACFSPDCVPPPIAAFTCHHAHTATRHKKGHAHRHLASSPTQTSGQASEPQASQPSQVPMQVAGDGEGVEAGARTMVLATTWSSDTTRLVVTEVCVGLLVLVWLHVALLLWMQYHGKEAEHGSEEERSSLLARQRMVLEETKAAGPEDDGDTEEEEEEDNPQDDDSVGHRKLVIVDQLPTPPHDSRAQGWFMSLPLWARLVSLVLVYYCCSIGIVYLNAYILDELFPYPATLTMFHMLSGSLVSAFLIYGVGVCPKVEGVTWRRYLTLIVPLAAVYAYQLWSSNAAYLYLAVGYIQMLKPVAGVAIYLLLVAAGKEMNDLRRGLTLVVILGGIGVASVGTNELSVFSWEGVLLVLGAAFTYALYMVGSQLVLQDSGLKLDPVSQLLLLGPMAALALAVVASIAEWTDDAFTFADLPWWLLLLDCLLAVGVNLCILAFLRYLSALLLLFAAYFKDILTVAIAMVAEHESVNGTELQGYALLLVGLATWRYMAYMKEQEDKAGRGASDVADPKEMRAVRGHKTARRKKGARPAPESV